MKYQNCHQESGNVRRLLLIISSVWFHWRHNQRHKHKQRHTVYAKWKRPSLSISGSMFHDYAYTSVYTYVGPVFTWT